jgi:hypothetical protein
MVEQAQALFDAHGPFTVAQLVDRVPGFSALAPPELRLGRQTVQAMCNAGELVRVGTRRVFGSRRPLTLYAPAPVDAGPAVSGLDALAAALLDWPSASTLSTEV